ncbi:MAG: hypothetical protein WC924_02160 [Candidatus Gracilibacteria bacterium]
MVIPCFKFGFEDPFASTRRVYLQDPESVDTKLENAKLDAEKKIDASKLVPESAEHLNKLLTKTTYSQAEVVIDNLDAAIKQLKAIDGLRDMLGKEGTVIAMVQFDAAYGDFALTPDEIKELAQTRQDATTRLDLIEAHKVRDINKLKAYALLFLRDSSGKPLSMLDASLADGETLTVNFKDPVTGRVNEFAKNTVTLGMVLEAVKRDRLTVSNRIYGRPPVTAYLWSDHKTYDQPVGSTDKKKYVEILDNYKLTTPEAEVAPAAPKEDELKELLRSDAEPQESYNPDFIDARGYMSDEDYAKAKAKDEAALARGETAYREATTMYIGKPAGDSNINLQALIATSTPEPSLDSLRGYSVEVPKHFRGEDSYEQIEKIKYLKNGQAVYDAIRMMAAIYREVRGPIDNRNMWKELRGGIFSRGGHWKIAFNEMAKTVYGKNENKLDDFLPYIKEFKTAAQTLLTTLDKTKEVAGANGDAYKNQREAVVYTGEKIDMARLTGEVFDRDSYGPPVSLNVFQSIRYGLSKKDRPTVNSDIWTSKVATSRSARGYKVYGEQEVISHARAFDKMMAVGSRQEYLDLLNNYLDMGRSLLVGKNISAPERVIIDHPINPAFKLSEDQIMAIRYGAMYFAAAELGVYQKVDAAKKDAEAKDAAGEIAGNLAEQAAAGGQLNSEQKAKLEAELSQKIYGVLSAYASVQPGEKEQYLAGLEGGLGITLLDASIPGRLSLQWTVRADEKLNSPLPIPILTTGPGLIYNVDFGKNKRWHADAYAKALGGFDKEGNLAIGPTIGVDASYDLTESGTLAVGTGASLGLREDGDIAGTHLSLDRNLSRVLQKKVVEFREEHSAELNVLQFNSLMAINELNVDEVQKNMLWAQYEKYMDHRIAYDETKDFTKWYKQVKLISVGLTAAVGLKEGGFAVGPYITIGIGFRAQTLYVPPLETPDQVVRSMETGLPTGIEGYKVPEADWIKAEVSDQILWDGNAASKDAAYARAETESARALDAMSKGVADDVEMTADGKFTNIEFKNLNGKVRLYTDGRAGIETIQDGPQDLALNLDSNDQLLIRILEIPAAQGGDNAVVIGITNNPSASLDDIVTNSSNYLAWNQTPDGEKSNSVLASNPEAVDVTSVMMTRGEAEKRLAESTMALGDLTKEGAKQNVHKFQYEDLRRRSAREDASERFTEAEKDLAELIANELIKADYNYRKLVLSSNKEEIHKKIVELYKERSTPAEGNLVKLVHQYAMEIDRPRHRDIPLEWNERAFAKIAGEDSTLAAKYFKMHAAELKEGGMQSAFPEGSEFLVTIMENGDVIMLGGYYNKAVYGEILAPVKWDPKNPKSTLEAMGMVGEDTKAVEGIAAAIADLNWEEKPLVGTADFNTARETMTGDKLLTTRCSNDLYGAADGAKLRRMADENNPKLFPALAKEYAEDVAKLLLNKQATIRGNPVAIDWEVYSGLNDKCFNLTFARNVKLVYEIPGKKDVQSASTREKVETGMTPEMSVKYNTLRIAPSVIPIMPGVGNANEDATGREGPAAKPGDVEPGEDPSTEHPRL